MYFILSCPYIYNLVILFITKLRLKNEIHFFAKYNKFFLYISINFKIKYIHRFYFHMYLFLYDKSYYNLNKILKLYYFLVLSITKLYIN